MNILRLMTRSSWARTISLNKRDADRDVSIATTRNSQVATYECGWAWESSNIQKPHCRDHVDSHDSFGEPDPQSDLYMATPVHTSHRENARHIHNRQMSAYTYSYPCDFVCEGAEQEIGISRQWVRVKEAFPWIVAQCWCHTHKKCRRTEGSRPGSCISLLVLDRQSTVETEPRKERNQYL